MKKTKRINKFLAQNHKGNEWLVPELVHSGVHILKCKAFQAAFLDQLTWSCLWLTSWLSIIISFRWGCEKEIKEEIKIGQIILKGGTRTGLTDVIGNIGEKTILVSDWLNANFNIITMVIFEIQSSMACRFVFKGHMAFCLATKNSF